MNQPTTSRTLVAWTYVLTAINIVLIVSPTGREFIPSELAIWLGFSYGALCAALHGLLIGLARKRATDTAETGKRRARPIGDPLLVGILFQLCIGTAGFADGGGGLYTQVSGSLSRRTYTVANVQGATNPRCWKHWFDEVSYVQFVLGAPCLKTKHRIESIFMFSGRSSTLGFKYYEYTVQPPERHAR